MLKLHAEIVKQRKRLNDADFSVRAEAAQIEFIEQKGNKGLCNGEESQGKTREQSKVDVTMQENE